MKKVSFLLPVYIVILLLSSCEPARPGGGDVAPTSSYSGEQKEPTDVVAGKRDSSVEKSLMEKNNTDTAQNK